MKHEKEDGSPTIHRDGTITYYTKRGSVFVWLRTTWMSAVQDAGAELSHAEKRFLERKIEKAKL